jgi:hypothetical protein
MISCHWASLDSFIIPASQHCHCRANNKFPVFNSLCSVCLRGFSPGWTLTDAAGVTSCRLLTGSHTLHENKNNLNSSSLQTGSCSSCLISQVLGVHHHTLFFTTESLTPSSAHGINAWKGRYSHGVRFTPIPDTWVSSYFSLRPANCQEQITVSIPPWLRKKKKVLQWGGQNAQLCYYYYFLFLLFKCNFMESKLSHFPFRLTELFIKNVLLVFPPLWELRSSRNTQPELQSEQLATHYGTGLPHLHPPLQLPAWGYVDGASAWHWSQIFL